MVTFQNMCRFGNFLFEAAATIGYAKRHNLEFTMPTTTSDPIKHPIFLQWLVNEKYNPSLPVHKVNQVGHGYHELPFEESWRDGNILLKGYFQSEKYFAEYRDEIINLFGFRNEFRMPNTTSVFIRRGDYLNHPNHFTIPTTDYLYSSMDYVHTHTGCKKFIVCSDDIGWCRENIRRDEYEIEFSNGLPFDIEMKYMASCDNHIGSGSTFSWWAAWFNENKNKVVVMPKDWFGERLKYLDQKDVCPESWVRL
jgi:hypothetical protein